MAKMSFIERVSCFMYLPYLSSEVKEKRVFPNECTCRGRYEMCCLYILQSTYGTPNSLKLQKWLKGFHQNLSPLLKMATRGEQKQEVWQWRWRQSGPWQFWDFNLSLLPVLYIFWNVFIVPLLLALRLL